MLSTLSELFSQFTGSSSSQSSEDRAQALRLAAAVLLVEVMRAQPGITAAEREAATAALRRRYTLDADGMAHLLAQAEAEARKANDFFHFTSQINDHCSQPDKIALVEAMWQVAYADGGVDENEQHVISKVAGLLYVTHGEYIAAKLRAKEAALARSRG